MSRPLTDVWAGSQTPDTNRPYPNDLLEHLEAEGLLAYGRLKSDDYLTDRDGERLRVLRFIADHPEGTTCSHITSYVCKGVRKNRCNVDFSNDSDYWFVNNYVHDLANHDPPLVEITEPSGDFRVTPTLSLLDLISYGIRETTEDNDLIYDREFCEQILRSSRGDDWRLSDSQKDILANSLRRYINRVDDYCLAFDVTLDGAGRGETRRMTKPYKTRFNSEGRKRKSFARLQQSLDHLYEVGDCAVFTTKTCWPKLQDSLYQAVQDINPAFHNLTQFMASDPSTKQDTRKAGVSSWRPGLDDAVTGRPRETLEYLKVLEFTENGYPHLHTLFVDPPRRESDGMPWLMDKAELSHRWEQYGMAKVVDLYPMVYRDDLKPEGTDDDDLDDALADLLPDLDTQAGAARRAARRCVEDTLTRWYRDEHLRGARFNAAEGFVCWYQFGSHDHTEEWVQERIRFDPDDPFDMIDMAGDDDQPMQKTAGSYLGKYVSQTYGKLLDDESFEDSDWNHEGKDAAWKIAMYWATQRQFWSISQGVRDAIRLDDDEDDHDPRPEIQPTVRELTRDSVAKAIERVAGEEITGLDGEIPTAPRKATETVVRKAHATVDFLGAYPIWNLPATTLTAQPLSDLEDADRDPDSPVELASRGDRPPPVADAW